MRPAGFHSLPVRYGHQTDHAVPVRPVQGTAAARLAPDWDKPHPREHRRRELQSVVRADEDRGWTAEQSDGTRLRRRWPDHAVSLYRRSRASVPDVAIDRCWRRVRRPPPAGAALKKLNRFTCSEW